MSRCESFLQDRLLRQGWSPDDRGLFPPALVLAVMMAILPLLLHLPVDTDRALPLCFLPALWLLRKKLRPASHWERGFLTTAVCVMVVAALTASHPARALVMTAAVGWTFAGIIVARTLAPCLPAVRLVLAGIVAGAILGLLMVRWKIGGATMPFPTYWSPRLFGAHQFAGALASLGLLVLPGSQPHLRSLAVLAVWLTWTGLAWSGGRGPVVGLAAMLGFWLWRGQAAERKTLLLWVPPLAAVALASSYALGVPYPDMGWAPQLTRTLEASGALAVTSGRSEFWHETWVRIAEAPWLGHGADGYLFIRPAQWGSQPHNVVLQWLFEYGWLGAISLLLLLGRGLASSWGGPAHSHRHWASAALLGAVTFGLFEGVFYHAIIFLPVAMFCGIALGLGWQPAAPSPSVWLPRFALGGLGVGAVLLIGHGWLFWQLQRAPNLSPDSLAMRALRHFPSTTDGLRGRLATWRTTHPHQVLPWTEWAQTVAPDQGVYHLYAAQLHLWAKDFAAGERELVAARAAVCVNEQPDVDEILRRVRLSMTHASEAGRR